MEHDKYDKKELAPGSIDEMGRVSAHSGDPVCLLLRTEVKTPGAPALSITPAEAGTQ